MGLKAETVALINQREQRISDEQANKIAREERAKIKFEAHKAKIRQGLSDLNQQLAGDPKLQEGLSAVLRAKNDYKSYNEVMGLDSPCIGVPIARTPGQIAVMTPTGIQVLKEKQGFKWNVKAGRNTETHYELLSLAQANVDGLFPKARFPVNDLPETIIKVVLQSPNKK